MALHTTVVRGDPDPHPTDLLALLVREGEKPGPVDAALEGLLSRCAKEEEFSGKEGQVLSLHTHGRIGPQRVALLGLGKEKDADRTLEQLRLAASRAVKLAKSAGRGRWHLRPPRRRGAGAGAIRGSVARRLRVRPLQEGEEEPQAGARGAAGGGEASRALPEAARLGSEVADAVCAARDLVNEPAGQVTPRALAAEARRMAAAHGRAAKSWGARGSASWA